MGGSIIRILVVDDYEPWQDFVSATFRSQANIQVVGRVLDGLEAVKQAQQLQPDLVLMDISLPTLNGIEAARRIREISPRSKILFLSENRSPDIAEEALSTGAGGYVVKWDAGNELLHAVKAVLQGKRFVSRRLGGHNFILQGERTGRHESLFYSDDACLLDSFTEFIKAALEAGNSVIVLATESHRDSLLTRLQKLGVDIRAVVEQGRYISLDAADTLSAFMVNSMPDPVRFLKVAGDLVLTAVKYATGECSRVAACGEGAPLLWAQGNAEAAILLEQLWDKVGKTYDLDILCGYPLSSFQGGMGSLVFEKICAEHSAVHSR